MIFKVAYSKGNRNSIKVVDNEGKEVWMGCSKNVYSWCKKNYNEGDEVDVEYTVKDGQYTATRVTNKRQSNYNPLPKDETRPSKPTPSAPTKKYTAAVIKTRPTIISIKMWSFFFIKTLSIYGFDN